MIKLNLGSNKKKIDGYTNVDALKLENVDIVHNLIDFPYPFESDSVDEILMVEVLEHISWRKTEEVLRECYRILKVGGKLHIQVPDIREMMFAYWNGQICSCCAHKPKDKADGVAKLDCPNCNGYGRVNPMRWKMAFCGSQKSYTPDGDITHDIHKNIFTPEILEENLENAGFDKIDIGQDEYGWKIKCNCIK